MIKSVFVVSDTNLSEFSKQPCRTYRKDSPAFQRNFDYCEHWLIKNGEMEAVDIASDKHFIIKSGEVIECPVESGMKKIKFAVDTEVVQLITNKQERNRIATNIMINWMIIETILNAISVNETDRFYEFTSVPNESGWLFESAIQGDLYQDTQNWNLVDKIVQNFVERTGIREEIWYGKNRLKTGLKLSISGWDSEASIDYIEDCTSGDDVTQIKQAYTDLKKDPLQIGTQIEPMQGDEPAFTIPNYKQHLYTLESLVKYVALNIYETENKVLHAVYPKDFIIRLPRYSENVRNDKTGMPNKVEYGNTFATVIKKILWTSSVGYEQLENLTNILQLDRK